jgi:hypothetical protein
MAQRFLAADVWPCPGLLGELCTGILVSVPIMGTLDNLVVVQHAAGIVGHATRKS